MLAALAGIAGTEAFLADFGQRDQLVALSMLPFVLGQVILTRRIDCPRALLAAVFAVGAVLVLLKPHNGLLPVVFLGFTAPFTQKTLDDIQGYGFSGACDRHR